MLPNRMITPALSVVGGALLLLLAITRSRKTRVIRENTGTFRVAAPRHRCRVGLLQNLNSLFVHQGSLPSKQSLEWPM